MSNAPVQLHAQATPEWIIKFFDEIDSKRFGQTSTASPTTSR